MVASQVPTTLFLGNEVQDFANQLNLLLRYIKNDSNNGADLHLYSDVAGIGNVDVGDLEDTQIRFYQDTSDSDRKWSVTKLGGSLFKSEYVAI